MTSDHAPTSDLLPVHDLPLRQAGKTFGLLRDVSVLDLTNSVAGPYATMLLADLGAEVIKVEPPGSGDDARHWGPPFLNGTSLWFLSINRNKKSVTLDYATPEGGKILARLAASVDVVVVNLRLSAQVKLGIDYPSLKAHRDDLIFCSITGFGLTGPKRDLAAYDLIAEGYSGVMDITGELENEPQKIGTPAADLLAGMDAAYAVVASLYDRQRTGRGHLIDVSLVDSMTRFLTPRIVPYLGSGEVPRRSGARDSVISIYQTFHTADQLMTLGLGNDGIFRRFCQAIGRSEWAADPRYADNAKRRALRAELVARIQAELVRQPRAYWLDLFAAKGVPAGPINQVDELMAEPHFATHGLFYAIPTDAEPVPQLGTGWQLDGEVNGYTLPPPALGAHTTDVLASRLDLADPEIERLRSAGIV